MRSRAVSLRRHLVGVMVVLVATGASLATISRSAAGEDAKYVFSNVKSAYTTDEQTNLIDASSAEVSYDIAWSSETYPGASPCTWRVYDPQGSVIGEQSDSLMVLRPTGAHGVRKIPVSGGVPSSAEISCGSRLDQVGNYDVSNVRVGPMMLPDQSRVPSSITVTFDARWKAANGSATTPGAASCSVTGYGSSGDVLVQRNITLVVASGSATGLEGILPADDASAEEPASATVDCQPFGG